MSAKPNVNLNDLKASAPDQAPNVLARPKREGTSSVPLRWKTWLALSLVVVGLAFVLWHFSPWIWLLWNTISTDDAYVDGHVTMVAPRVEGQVTKVFVDDNMRVKKGDILLEIDPEPFQVQVEIQQANVQVAESELANAKAAAAAQLAQIMGARYALVHAIESVRDQIAQLQSNVAAWKVQQAALVLAEKNFARDEKLVPSGAISNADIDLAIAQRDEAKSRVDEAFQIIQQNRTNLGLPRNTENPLDVPENLDQSFSLVRQSLATLLQALANLGYKPASWSMTPSEAIEVIFKDEGNSDDNQFFEKLAANSPEIKYAEAQLLQAQRNLQHAELELSYCTIVSEIDGIVTRRNVNPGNYVQPGESVMAVRSLEEIWINANFKETQLTDLRIGQHVELHVDMYGSDEKFYGRITGFSMGTGQTLALLPPQNATGNYVKIVQRLPVRIEVVDYDPDKRPLYTGLSIEPYVFYKEPATGPQAGRRLQSQANIPRDNSDRLP
ncbi:HlyD family secretion protein [Blastopirellula marina]|uniref:HlyD family secretion protein n=1 Tax=Blastopirellula marina TaxID=124 RepID=A0A2S8FNA2_9BACT|nr:HlyD family secretion protein [Blastopirellula marina]PQO33678.1 HlyD family secretion protein [Blastopirellula marina]PTL43465.1 HlyD family secretion protein [Blastopirellula marina]